MIDHPLDEDRLFDEALELIVRQQGDQDAVEQVRQWRRISPAHEAAWAEAAAIHGMTGKVLSDRHKTGSRGGRMGRRVLLLGGLAAGGALTMPGLVTRARADFITSTAEIRRVPLSDGSFATLGPDSALALRSDEARRGVELLSGMAYFEIAGHPTRTFIVRAGPVTATTQESRFELGRDAQTVSVMVARGAVDVQLDHRTAGQRRQLSDGDRLALDADGDVAMAARAPEQVAIWRDGLIMAEKEPVAAVVARIARWQPGRVLLAAPSLGHEQISGVFDLKNPHLALEAVVHPYGGKVRRISQYLTVISRV